MKSKIRREIHLILGDYAFFLVFENILQSPITIQRVVHALQLLEAVTHCRS